MNACRDSSRLPRQKPREIAVRVLCTWANKSIPADSLLSEALPRLSGPDRGLCQELVLGVIRWMATLDWLIEQKTDGRRQQPLAHILLRLGLYQIFYLDRVPDYAVVNEMVSIASQYDLGRQGGFINAVLRNCLRERELWSNRLDALRKRQPAIGYSHPQWLVQRWEDRWEDYQTLLEWNNQPAPIYARRNTLRATDAELEAQWKAEGVAFEAADSPWLKKGSMYRIELNDSLASLESFKGGYFYIQDPSTLAPVQEIDPRPGENILDLCAAPGGKSSAIAQRMQDKGSVLATDIDDARLERMNENIARLGINCIQSKPLHGIDLNTAGPFDRILVDAPCSNTGVMRRRVDVRWRLQARDFPPLARKQFNLLKRASRLLKPDGVLVYSTCSLEVEENEEVIERFLKKHPHYRQENARMITPMKDGVDGAFVARLRRDSSISGSV